MRKRKILHALIKTYTFTYFWETFTYTIIRPCTIICQVTIWLCNLKVKTALILIFLVKRTRIRIHMDKLWKLTQLLTLFYEKLFLTGYIYILSLKKLSKSPLEVSAAFSLGTILGLAKFWEITSLIFINEYYVESSINIILPALLLEEVGSNNTNRRL